MSRRVTIVLDDDIIEKLRKIQAKKIKDTAKGISFSKVINEILKNHI